MKFHIGLKINLFLNVWGGTFKKMYEIKRDIANYKFLRL